MNLVEGLRILRDEDYKQIIETSGEDFIMENILSCARDIITNHFPIMLEEKSRHPNRAESLDGMDAFNPFEHIISVGDTAKHGILVFNNICMK